MPTSPSNTSEPRQKLTAGEIYTSFPDYIKTEIGRYTPLVEKTSDELHAVLQEIRVKFRLPPWHVITLYFKLTAARSINSDKQYWEQDRDSGSCFTDSIPRPKSWIWMFVKAKRGELESEPRLVAVCPEINMLWSVDSERPTNGPTYAVSFNSGMYKSVNIKTKAIISRAEALLISGKTAEDIPTTQTFEVKEKDAVTDSNSDAGTSEKAKAAIALAAKIRTDIVTPKQELPKPVLKPIEVKSVIFAEDAEMFLTMFDLAKQKLLEMGCEETVIRWKKKLDKLLGKESNE